MSRFWTSSRHGRSGRRRLRRGDDERRAHDAVVVGLAVADHAVLVELLAVVGVEHEDRLLVEPRLPEKLEQRSEVGIRPVQALVVERHRVRDVFGGGVELALADLVNRVEREVEIAGVLAVEVLALVGVEERVVRVGRVEEDEELLLAVVLDEPEHFGHLVLQGLLPVAEHVPALIEPERLRDPALHERRRAVAGAAEGLRDQGVVLGRAGGDAQDLGLVFLVPLLLDRELGDVTRGQHRRIRGQRVGRLRDAARETHAASGHGVEGRRRVARVALEGAVVGAHGIERDPDDVHAAPGSGGILAAARREERKRG